MYGISSYFDDHHRASLDTFSVLRNLHDLRRGRCVPTNDDVHCIISSVLVQLHERASNLQKLFSDPTSRGSFLQNHLSRDAFAARHAHLAYVCDDFGMVPWNHGRKSEMGHYSG